MTITIDMLSLFIGVACGLVVTMISFTASYYNDRYDAAFGRGWDYGCEYGRNEKEKDGEKE